jgi:hypothetical protein
VLNISVTFPCRAGWTTVCYMMMKYGNEPKLVLPRCSGAG